MKNLVLCADGTWNRDETVVEESGKRTSTNVSKLAVSVAAKDSEGESQLVFYMQGVGSKDSEMISGGAFGWGLSRNVLLGYQFLCRNYQPGDRIFLFGFSRGAYTVRSLAGLICNSGITRDPAHSLQAMEIYREKSDSAKSFSIRSRLFRTQFSHSANIHFLGVWDTVGAMGLPFLRHRIAKSLGWEWDFHSTDFRQKVLHAYHAVSINERRSKFQPVLKDELDRENVVEKWFYGVHSDIGGGYVETGLSNITLEWMIEQANKNGLAFVPRWKRELGITRSARPSDLMAGRYGLLDPAEFRRHEEWRGFFRLIDWRGHTRIARDADVHESVVHINNLLQSSFSVSPQKGWNKLDFSVEAGRPYEIRLVVLDDHPAKGFNLFRGLLDKLFPRPFQDWSENEWLCAVEDEPATAVALGSFASSDKAGGRIKRGKKIDFVPSKSGNLSVRINQSYFSRLSSSKRGIFRVERVENLPK
ncbi:MAG: DUF2235 domain-containing protein [Verrucomicrobiota bacterium]